MKSPACRLGVYRVDMMFVMFVNGHLTGNATKGAAGTGEDMMAKEVTELQLLHTNKWVNRAQPCLGDGIWDHRHVPTICISEPKRSLDSR